VSNNLQKKILKNIKVEKMHLISLQNEQMIKRRSTLLLKLSTSKGG